ncbi:MAG: hypothetical protein KGS09_16300 [Nitrospirae bacterium]|nr:hypothetical protein [Nitrospirota bacterium]MDE3041871.1 hypothetical protein [Nitrospirota bacterium]
MGLTKRKDSFYVEFPVLDDGKTLKLARGIQGAKLKRWKVGSLNRTAAKEQEALIKAELMKGLVKSSHARVISFKEWGEPYLNLEEVKRLRSYKDRREIVRNQLIPFFGGKVLTDISRLMLKRSGHSERSGMGQCRAYRRSTMTILC